MDEYRFKGPYQCCYMLGLGDKMTHHQYTKEMSGLGPG